MLFHVVDDAFVVLRSNGVYRQAKVYRRGNDGYAAYGSGFVRIMRQGTSVPKLNWDEIVIDIDYDFDSLGRMIFN